MKAFMIILIILYIAVNLWTAKLMNAREMKQGFIDGQCLVGKVCANIFYIPAWFLKAVRFVVMAVVK